MGSTHRRTAAGFGALLLTVSPVATDNALASPAPSVAVTAGGEAAALSVHVEINLPQAIPGTIPVVGGLQTLIAELSMADGVIELSPQLPEHARASAQIHDGNLAVLDELLDRRARAELHGNKSTTDDLAEENLGLIQVGAGTVTATVAAGPSSASSSHLDSFRLGLADVTSNGPDTDLLAIRGLTATQTVRREPSSSKVVAEANTQVDAITILGSLVSIEGVNSVATASTAGAPGSATAAAATTIGQLRVGDVLDVGFGPEGITGTLLGNTLPDVPADATDDVVDSLNGILATAGVVVRLSTAATTADPRGEAASAAIEGLEVVVNPLKAAKPLVSLRIGAARAMTGTAVTITEPGTDTPLVLDDGTLPATGGLPVAAPAAVLLATGLVLRRGAARRPVRGLR